MHGSLHGAMARTFKCVCDCNPSYFQAVKNHATCRVKQLLDATWPFSVCYLKLWDQFSKITSKVFSFGTVLRKTLTGEKPDKF